MYLWSFRQSIRRTEFKGENSGKVKRKFLKEKKKLLHLLASLQNTECKLKIILIISFFQASPEVLKTVGVSRVLDPIRTSHRLLGGMRLVPDWVQLRTWLVLMQTFCLCIWLPPLMCFTLILLQILNQNLVCCPCWMTTFMSKPEDLLKPLSGSHQWEKKGKKAWPTAWHPPQ